LISELGKAEADRIAALYGKPHALSTCRGSRRIASKKTPAASRLMQKQSMVPRRMERDQTRLNRSVARNRKATAMAKALGSHIGATAPAM
jgi:hypothetical protein